MFKGEFPKVSIILLNYNGAEDTIACLESLKSISYPNYKIVIVDNNSTDNSFEQIESYLKGREVDGIVVLNSTNQLILQEAGSVQYSLIQSGKNGGYGHGNNIGIKYALQNEADYVLVLNNDTTVQSDFLEPMVKMCEEDKNIGIASEKIYFYDRPDTIWFNGGKFSPCTAKVEHFNFNEKDIGQVPKEPITFISGCMWLIPKKVFDDIGFINEEYFMYMEDLEFCERVLDKGYKLKIADKNHIFHKVGGASSGQLSSFSVYYRAKNKLSFILKKLTLKCRVQALFSLIFLESFRYIYKKRSDLLKSHIKGITFAIIK